MSVYKQSRRDLSLPYALLSSKKKGSEYQHPESPFATVCTVAAGLQQVYYLLTVKFPRISWSSSNSEYLIHKIMTFHELKTVRWFEFITVRLHSPTSKPHKKYLILEDQNYLSRDSWNFSENQIGSDLVILLELRCSSLDITGNSSCEDYILLILEFYYHAHDPCVTNCSLGL